MDGIYLDNAATSWPKPPEVIQAITEYWCGDAATISRSSGRGSERLEQQIVELRDDLRVLLNANSAREISFCLNATDAINLAINGLVLTAKRTQKLPNGRAVRRPLRVLTSRAEHNSVLRPLHYWQQAGELELMVASCDRSGKTNDAEICDWIVSSHLGPIDLVCLTHASNVTGIINRLETVGEICRQNETLLLIDAAQTVGHLPVDVQNLKCDFLTSSGHKGLLGPLGTGFLYIRESISSELDCLRSGGTGTSSSEVLPELRLPQKWESGNPNVPGLVGLATAVSGISHASLTENALTANQLASRLWEGLSQISGIDLIADSGENPFAAYGPEETLRLPILSCVSEVLDPQTLAESLGQAGIISRSGYHCAPWIHAVLGTEAGGTLRFSPGRYNTIDQIEKVIATVASISSLS